MSHRQWQTPCPKLPRSYVIFQICWAYLSRPPVLERGYKHAKTLLHLQIAMVANSIPQGQVKAGDKIVNDVKLTNIPSGRFDGQLRPYSQADVDKLR